MLTNQKHQAVALYASQGHSAPQIAKSVGRSERTVFRILQRDDVKGEVSRLRRAMLERTVDRLTQSGNEAAETIIELMRNGPASVRLKAAESVVNLAGKMRSNIEFEQRIRELEARAESTIVNDGLADSSHVCKQARHDRHNDDRMTHNLE